MHKSQRPFEFFVPEPPSAANGWGRWVSGVISSIDARMSHLDRHAELTTEHIMDLRERLAALEKPAALVVAVKEPPPPRPSLMERAKGLKDILGLCVTGLVWLLTITMAVAHALGLPWAEKLRGVIGALGGPT